MPEWYDDPQPSLPVNDRILAQTTALLAQRGDGQAVALLIDVQSMTFANTGEVSRRGWHEEMGTYVDYLHQTALLDVEDHLTVRFTQDVRERIAAALSYIAERNDVPDVTYVEPRPALPEVDENWRKTYAARLVSERPTNQARRERDLAQYPTEDGLTFGSKEEVLVYQSLKRLQARSEEDQTIAIMPSPGVRLRAGHTWTPDFIVTGRRRALVIEVDGPHHRGRLRRADDANRDLQWSRCRIPVVRLAVEDLTDEKALDARIAEELRRHLPRSSS